MRIPLPQHFKPIQFPFLALLDLVFLALLLWGAAYPSYRMYGYEAFQGFHFPYARSARPDDKTDPYPAPYELHQRPEVASDPLRLVIRIMKDGTLLVSGETRSMQWVRDALVTHARLCRDPETGICDRPVYLRADERVAFRHIRKVFDMCLDKHIKIRRVTFATRPSE